MKKYLFLFALMVSACFSNAQNRSIEFDHGTFSEIVARAKKENKMIYIDCYTSWCGPCKWMAKNVFTNDTVADFYNMNFINAKIDMEQGEGIDIAKKYDIRAYPTMLFLSSEGVQLHRTCGSSPVATFIQSGKDALSPNTQLANYAANFNAGNVTAQYAGAYFSMLQNACQSYGKEVQDYFTFVKKEDLRSRSNWNIIYRYIDDYTLKTFTDFEADRNAFIKLYGKDSVEDKINSVYVSGLYSAIQNNDDDGYSLLKKKLHSSKTEDAEQIILEADVKLYQRKGDWANYGKYASEYVNKYVSSNAGELNSYAWTFYEKITSTEMLKNAEAWAKKATELEMIYPYLDTYAAVLYKSGKKKEAKAAAEKAIEIAKKNGDDYGETAALLKKIESMK